MDKELRTVTAFKPDIADLTKKFIAYTTNETIVNKTAAMIEKLKGLDPELDLDNDVEEGKQIFQILSWLIFCQQC